MVSQRFWRRTAVALTSAAMVLVPVVPIAYSLDDDGSAFTSDPFRAGTYAPADGFEKIVNGPRYKWDLEFAQRSQTDSDRSNRHVFNNVVSATRTTLKTVPVDVTLHSNKRLPRKARLMADGVNHDGTLDGVNHDGTLDGVNHDGTLECDETERDGTFILHPRSSITLHCLYTGLDNRFKLQVMNSDRINSDPRIPMAGFGEAFYSLYAEPKLHVRFSQPVSVHNSPQPVEEYDIAPGENLNVKVAVDRDPSDASTTNKKFTVTPTSGIIPPIDSFYTVRWLESQPQPTSTPQPQPVPPTPAPVPPAPVPPTPAPVPPAPVPPTPAPVPPAPVPPTPAPVPPAPIPPTPAPVPPAPLPTPQPSSNPQPIPPAPLPTPPVAGVVTPAAQPLPQPSTPPVAGVHVAAPKPPVAGVHTLPPTAPKPPVAGVHVAAPKPPVAGVHTAAPKPPVAGKHVAKMRLAKTGSYATTVGLLGMLLLSGGSLLLFAGALLVKRYRD